MKKFIVLLFVGAFLFAGGTSVQAMNVAGYNFANNAFADQVASYSGQMVYNGFTLESSVTGSNLFDYAYSWTPGAYIELKFTDNLVVNQAGADLVLFELGVANAMEVSLELGGPSVVYQSHDTGYNARYNVNAALVNLSDFGLAENATISSLFIRMDLIGEYCTVPALAAVGALDSVPVPIPGAGWLLSSGFALLAVKRRIFF